MPTENYITPGEHTFNVPAYSEEIDVELFGAQGGAGGDGDEQPGGTGGDGARLTATIAVNGGETATIIVGEEGFNGNDAEQAGGDGAGGAGGSPNGEAGEDAGTANDEGGGGGGGGSTTIELDGAKTVVAGAGGGAGGATGIEPGSDGGAGQATNAGSGYGGGGGSAPASGDGGDSFYVAEAVDVSQSAGANSGDGSASITYTDPPNAPSDVAQDVEDDDTVTVTVTPDNPDNDPEEYEYERSLDGGAYTAVTTTSNTQITDTVPESADSIQYRARAVNDVDVSAWVESGTETTNAVSLTVTSTDAGSIGLSWTDPSANDGTDVLLADASGTVAGDYTVAESLGPSEGSTTLTGLENGETYYARVQATYTGADQTPAPVSNEVSTTTEPVPPSLDALDTATVGEIALTYTLGDNSPDGNVEIERSDDGGQTFTTIATVTDLSATSYTDTTVTPGDQYTYRLTRNTSDASVESNTLTDYAAFDPPTTQGLVLQGGGTTQVLERDEIVAKDIKKVHSGVGDARIDVPQNSAIIPRVQRHDRAFYYVNGNCVFTGYALGFVGNERTGRWTLRIDGIGKRLEETRPDYDGLGGPLVYTNTALDDAIRDYWSRTPFTATVTDQVPELVAENEELQSADTTAEWQSLITPVDTDPISIANGTLSLEQTCWTQEGENATASNVASNADAAYSGGSSAIFLDVGDFAEWTFTPQYDIPDGEFRIAYRNEGDGGSVDIEWSVNGVAVETTNNPLMLGWDTVNADELDVLQAGNQVTVRAEVVSDGGGNRRIDVVAPNDNRFSYTFDNANGGGGGYLDGPELYPIYDVTLPAVTTAYNIPRATITTTWNDTTGDQAIAVSNDNGATFLTSSNTETDTFDFNTSGRQAIARFTLSGGGTRTTATPQTGYIGQEVQDYSLDVDLNDLVVIDKLELSRDHFANLKQLHDYGGFLWVIEHDDGDVGTLLVSSFMRGEETRTSPPEFSDVANIKPEVAAENYFNSIYLEGALQDDGTRPTAEVMDSDAIAADGREITPGVLRDQSISTEAGATFRANALLQAALANNELRGTIETSPTYVQPGFSYSVTFGDTPDEKTLESVSITESAGSVQATYEFVTREQLSNTLDDLKREGRTIGNEV